MQEEVVVVRYGLCIGWFACSKLSRLLSRNELAQGSLSRISKPSDVKES